jgi:hypothetical protein
MTIGLRVFVEFCSSNTFSLSPSIYIFVFKLTITFEVFTSHVGCHTTTYTKLEVMFDINATCVHFVEKCCAAFAQTKTTGVNTKREDIIK